MGHCILLRMGQGWVLNLDELNCYARCQEMMLKERICMGSPPWLASRCQIKLVEVSNTSHPNGLQRAFSFCSGSMSWTNTRRNSDVALHSWSWCPDVFKKWVAWMESQRNYSICTWWTELGRCRPSGRLFHDSMSTIPFFSSGIAAQPAQIVRGGIRNVI